MFSINRTDGSMERVKGSKERFDNVHRKCLVAKTEADLIKQYEDLYKNEDGKSIHIICVSDVFHADDNSCSMFYDYRVLRKEDK